MLSTAVGGCNVNALNYFVAQKYVEAFGGFAKSANEKLIFMPMEASSLVSAIGGISELVKDSMKGSGENPGPVTPSAPRTGPWKSSS